MLPFDDSRWRSLHSHDKGGRWVRRWLGSLLENPDNMTLFQDGAWQLWSDENTWSASFAAAPYLVEAATKAKQDARLEYIVLLGKIAAYRTKPGADDELVACPQYLEESFQTAIENAVSLAIKLLPIKWSEWQTAQLIAAVAAFKGMLALSRAIESGGIFCKSCNRVVETHKYACDDMEEIPF